MILEKGIQCHVIKQLMHSFSVNIIQLMHSFEVNIIHLLTMEALDMM